MRLDADFRALMFKLTQDEYSKLEQHIINEGCRDALIVWDDHKPASGSGELILIDGYNRYEICTKQDIEFKTISMQFNNREAVSDWIIDNQLGKRNLTVEQKNYLIGKKYKKEKQAHGGNRKSTEQNVLLKDTANLIAEQHKVSHMTVKRAEKFADAVDVIAQNVGNEARDKILAQEIKVDEKDVIAISKLDAEIQQAIIIETQSGKKLKQALKAEKQKRLEAHTMIVEKADRFSLSSTEKQVEPGSWWELHQHRLYCGDTAEATFYDKIPKSVFAFADPPYNAGVAEWDVDFIWRHDWLENKAEVVAVTPGIASIFDFSRITKMPYRWSVACWIDNGMTRGAMGFGNWIYVALFSTTKVYTNSQDFVKISIQIEDRPRHKGQKPSQLIIWLIDKFSQKGDFVIDPFLGSGTTLFACESTGRVCYGGEINPKYCADIITQWEKMTNKTALRCG